MAIVESIITIQNVTAMPVLFLASAWVTISSGMNDGFEFMFVGFVVYLALIFIENRFSTRRRGI
jgi:hypothetical protein